MLWIALYLPDLSLQLAVRAGQGHTTPLVIFDGPANRPCIFAANAVARDAGIVSAMPLAAARALVTDVLCLARDPKKEEAALANLAGWATQFTPMVAIEGRDGVLLEVSASLKLFGGIAQLSAKVRKGAHELGYHSAIGVAPTALGAWLLARASAQKPGVRSCVELAALPSRLADLSLALFDWPPETQALLAELGIRTVADCLALPRDGLTRRLGHDVVSALDH